MSTLKQYRQNLNPPSNPTGQGSAGLVDSQEIVLIKPVSNLQFGNFGQGVSVSKLNVFDWFDLLPVATTVVATSDKYNLLLGTNTPLATQSTKGGLTLTTGGTNTNVAGIAGIANTGFSVPISATNGIVFRSRINLASATAMLASIGMNSTVTSINPYTDNAEGFCFLADPTNALVASTGATAAQALNWILVTSVATVITTTFTSVPIIALQDIVLDAFLDANLKWNYAINGIALPLTAAGAATLTTVLRVIGGVETLATATAAMDVRFVQLERSIG